jgi:hypothetical protein
MKPWVSNPSTTKKKKKVFTTLGMVALGRPIQEYCWVQGQRELHSETLSQKNKTKSSFRVSRLKTKWGSLLFLKDLTGMVFTWHILNPYALGDLPTVEAICNRIEQHLIKGAAILGESPGGSGVCSYPVITKFPFCLKLILSGLSTWCKKASYPFLFM